MSVEITLEQTEELIRNCKEQIAFTQECSRILDLKLLRYFCVYPVVEVLLVLQKRMVVNDGIFNSWGNWGDTYTSGGSISVPGVLLGGLEGTLGTTDPGVRPLKAWPNTAPWNWVQRASPALGPAGAWWARSIDIIEPGFQTAFDKILYQRLLRN